MKVLPILFGVLLVAPLAAQAPRGTTLVGDATGTAYDPAVSTHGELSAVVYKDSATEGVMLTTSDGRGLNWTTPIRVDAGSPRTKFLNRDAVKVVDDNIYVYWTDHRLPDDTLYFNYSTDRGATFLPVDIQINRGWLMNDVTQVRMEVFQGLPGVPTDDLVVFLIKATRDSTGVDEIHLNYSLDGGGSFLPLAIPFSDHNPEVLPVDVEALDLAIDQGGLIHGVFSDNSRHQIGDFDSVYYSKFDPVAMAFLFKDVLLNPLGDGLVDVEDSLVLSVEGSNVGVLWQSSHVLGGPEALMANTSLDGGLTFMPVESKVGFYVTGVDDVDNPQLAIAPNGDLFAIWEDNRIGPQDDIFMAQSMDGGVTWPLEQLMSIGGGEFPEILVAKSKGEFFPYPDSTTVIGTWCADKFPQVCQSRWSKNGGVLWDPVVVTSQNLGDVESSRLSYNEFYNNFIVAWAADDVGKNKVYSSGFRRQTLTAFGSWYVPGSPVHFEVSNWPENDHGWAFAVLASATPGDLFASNGRNFGLVPDSFFFRSRDMAVAGLLRGTIDMNGFGTTPVLTAPLTMPPVTIYVAAVAFQDPMRLGLMTDFMPLQ